MAEKKKVKKETKPAAKKKPAAAPKKKAAEKVEKKVKHAAPEIPVAPPVQAAPPEAPKAHYVPAAPKKPKLPKVEAPKYYGTGRRKEATAKVWLVPGTGKITANGRSMSQYFCNRKLLEFQINRPFAATKTAGSYDVFAEVFGGGVPGQAGAISLGIARALIRFNSDLKVVLKREGLLTRDPRMKERKKYGLKRARRAFQYTKR